MRKIEIDRKDLGIGDKFNFVNASESYKYIGSYSYNQIDYFLYKDISGLKAYIVCLQAKVHQSHLSVLYFKPS